MRSSVPMHSRWRVRLAAFAASTAVLGACVNDPPSNEDGGVDSSKGSGVVRGAGAAIQDTYDAADDTMYEVGIDSRLDTASVPSNCSSARSLLVNCSFETPTVPRGSFLTFSVGQAIGAWQVVGVAGGKVSPLSSAFQDQGFTFAAHDGAQTLDLTGPGSNSASGVSQSVATTRSARYQLSFWLGNIVNAGGSGGTTSSVNVLVDGVQILSAINEDGVGSTSSTWKGFVVSFVAAGASTIVQFRNADSSADGINLLDDITLLKE
jgi:hypothetical protein